MFLEKRLPWTCVYWWRDHVRNRRYLNYGHVLLSGWLQPCSLPRFSLWSFLKPLFLHRPWFSPLPVGQTAISQNCRPLVLQPKETRRQSTPGQSYLICSTIKAQPRRPVPPQQGISSSDDAESGDTVGTIARGLAEGLGKSGHKGFILTSQPHSNT